MYFRGSLRPFQNFRGLLSKKRSGTTELDEYFLEPLLTSFGASFKAVRAVAKSGPSLKLNTIVESNQT